MSGRSLIFLVIAAVAALLGFGILVGAISGFLKLVFIAFLVVLVVSIVQDNKSRKQNPPPSRPSSSGPGRR